MPRITVKEGQTIFDLAVQYLGHLSGAYLLAERNSLPLDAELAAGQVLIYKDTDVSRQNLVQYFIDNNIDIATGGTVVNPSPVILPEFITSIYEVGKTASSLTFAWVPNKVATLHYAVFLAPVTPSKGQILNGTNSIAYGALQSPENISVNHIVLNLTASTQYEVAGFLRDSHGYETGIVKISIRTRSVVIDPDPEAGEALPYALPFTLENNAN